MTTTTLDTKQNVGERYELLAPIGSGGMGDVYEANDSQTRRPVALKFARGCGKAAAYRQLAREAAAMALSRDKRICSVYDLATCEGRTCVVMERLVGQTLKSRLAAGSLSTTEVLDIALQLVVALEAIHRAGLVHQDVKPANVFLTALGEVKVLDFGLAVAAGEPVAQTGKGSKGSGGVVMGTPNYVAPERLLQRPADPRSDLFSLGAVIYEMAAGRPPFAADAPSDVLFNVLTDNPVSLEAVAPHRPAALARVVRKLLARNPDDRYRSAAEVRKALLWIRPAAAVEMTAAA